MTNRAAVVLAAGEGKRMKSDLPKVLHPLKGRPLLLWVLDAIAGAGLERTVVIIGHGGEEVRRAVGEREGVEFVWQREQRGTGHAVQQTASRFDGFDGAVVILSGDVPLVRPTTITDLLAAHEERGATATVVTTEMADPTGYGRILRDPEGAVDRIVEEKDATDSIRRIREINSGTYAFDAARLFAVLPLLRDANASGEFYLTDTIALLRAEGLLVVPYPVGDGWEVFGINKPEHLRAAEDHLNGREHG